MDWLKQLSVDGHTWEVEGYFTYSDAPLTRELFEPLKDRITRLILESHKRGAKEHWDLNIGIYQSGRDIRVWRVHHP